MTADSTDSPLPAPVEGVLARINAPALLAVGIMTFVTGYIVTALVISIGPSQTSGGLVGLIMLFAFIFYSAHLVPASLSGGGQIDQLTVSASPATPEPAIPVVVFYAIPMVLLIAAGVVATHLYTTDRLDPVEVLSGVLVLAVGYAAMATLGTFIVQTTTTDGQLASPDGVLAIGFGLLYPLVFGSIGAGLANVIESLRDLELF